MNDTTWRAAFNSLAAQREEELHGESPRFLDCSHEKTELCRRVVANGGVQYVHQCLNCGEAIGGPVAHSRVTGDVRDFDSSIKEGWQQRRRVGRSYDEIERDFRERWRELYSQYLRSAEWRRLRQEVILRSGGICEGCRKAQPDEIHHISYKHVGGELLFELVALCESCHARCHEGHEASPE